MLAGVELDVMAVVVQAINSVFCLFRLIVQRFFFLPHNFHHVRKNFVLISLMVRVGVFEQPTGREHKMAQKTGWKLSKVEIIGSARSVSAKNGKNGCWPIR